MAERLKLITDSIPAAIAYVDTDLRYRFVNRRYTELFERAETNEEVIGRTVPEIVDEAYFAGCEDHIRHALAGNEVSFFNEFRRKDGVTLYLQTAYIPHISESGNVAGHFVQHHDVTSLTLAQEALRASEEQYRTLFNTTGTASFVSELDTTISLANDGFYHLTGCTAAETEGRICWTEFVAPEYRELMLDYHRTRRVDPGKPPRVYECEVVSKNGTRHSSTVHVNLIPNTSRSIISFLDITPQKQLENSLKSQLTFLQTLVDTIPNPIYYKNRQGLYTDCNKAFERYLGHPRVDVIGKSAHHLCPPELADRYREMDEILFANPGVQVYESSVIAADGSRRDVIFNKATFTAEDGRVEGLVGIILDVTERKRAEEVLAEREEFLSGIFDGIQDGICVLDEELRIIRANPVIDRRFVHRGMVVGRTCYEAFHGRTEPCEFCPSLRTIKTGSPSFKIFSRVENDTELWLEIYTFPLFDSTKSRVTGVIEYSRDVTERKRAENALVVAEKKFRSLVEGSLVGTYIIQEGRFVYVNPKMAEIFGYTPDELTSGLSHLELTAPEDRHLAADNVRRRVAGEVPSINYGFRGLCKDGTKIDVEVYGTGTQYNGRPAIIGTLLDITARKQFEDALRESEDRFHRIFTQNDDGIFLMALEKLSIIDANPAAAELTGYTPEELRRLAPSSFIEPSDFRRLLDLIPMDDHSHTFQLSPATCIRKDGALLSVSIRAKILRLREEYIIYCSMRDITEKVRLEREVKSTQAKLIHANKMSSIGMLASSVAHEINNPNNCISVNSAMMTDIWNDAEPLLSLYGEEHGEFELRGLPFTTMREIVPRLLNGITEGSRRISGIVHNMRDYVREDKGGSYAAVDVNQLLQNATAILWHHIHLHTDYFSTVLADDLPRARGNAQQLEQVFINLIANALQALTDRSAAVTVFTGVDSSGETIAVTVRDEGAGMSRMVQANLAEPFFTTRADSGGTGLGLYISASIVKEHGGTLDFDSREGTGTTATVRLPVLPASV